MKPWGTTIQIATVGVLVLLFAVFVVPDVAFAQVVESTGEATNFGLDEVDDSIALANTNIILIITRIIRVMLGLIGIIVLGLMLYAGFLWMTSQGQEDKIAAAKRTLINATIGLAIIMSAFAIVQFVISSLSDATGGPPRGTPDGSAPALFDFTGSGALGEAIIDHYPFRFARDVPRNTKISITFREALDPATVIENTNNTCFTTTNTIVDCDDESANIDRPVYGDCLLSGDTAGAFDWVTQCDHLVTSSIAIFEDDVENAPLVTGAVLATFDDVAQTEIRTISIRPFETLGSSVEKRWYRVQLSRDIENQAGEGIFRNSRLPYNWQFETDTVLDLDPPIVESVFPESGETIAKNMIISITFDEAMDPVMVQGQINMPTHPFTNIIFGTTTITGSWRISNGYRTVEFIPDTPCDVVNSCGEVMYCLPVAGCESGADVQCENEYQTLVRTAQPIGSGTWESFPFSGVYDMASNLLDGDADGVQDGVPARPTGDTALIEINDGERAPDNYAWDFVVKNDIDRRIPYPYHITPGVDAEQIQGETPIKILFNMPMFVRTLYDIEIEEYPAVADYEQPWTYPLTGSESIPADVFGVATRASQLTVQHRAFAPAGETDLYYITSLGGGVRGVNQNCMYPGYGPAGQAGTVNTSCVRNEETGTTTHCVPVTGAETNDTGCAYVGVTGNEDQSQPDMEACLDAIKQDINAIQDSASG